MIKIYPCAIILSITLFSVHVSADKKTSPAKPAISNPVSLKSTIPVVTNFVEKSKKIKTEEKIPTKILTERLQTQDVAVLIATITQIGKQDKGSKYVLKEFEKLLNHKNSNVRYEVLNAAYSFDILKPLLPSLTKCLDDPVEDIRQDAADILGDIENRDMINVFVNALTNQYEDVRENAEFYLLFWTDEDFTNTAGWVTWWDKNKKTFVFE